MDFDFAEDQQKAESQATALMHLEAIYRVAAGEGSLKRDTLDKRRAALVAFIVSGQCLADDSDRELAARVNEAVNSHFSTVNAEIEQIAGVMTG